MVLDRLQDPGNVGTVLRSAAASGVKQIVLGNDCVDIWSPKVLRAGMGAHFLLDIYSRVSLLQWLDTYQDKIWATALDGRNPSDLYQLDLNAPCAWVFGNEGSGVSREILEKVDGSVRIPMLGQTESLNVAWRRLYAFSSKCANALRKNFQTTGQFRRNPIKVV